MIERKEKLLPHDFDSEQGLLAAAFYPGALDKIDGLVSAADFYSTSAGLIFEKMMEFHSAERGFTISMVEQSLKDHPEYESIRLALDSLRPITGTVITHFAEIVRELADRRRCIRASYSVYESLFDLSNPVDQVRGFLRVQVPGLLTGVAQ